MALHTNDPDFHFVLIHVTSGENGQIAEGSDATPETLGEVREAEDRRSWEVLGRVPDRHEWLASPITRWPTTTPTNSSIASPPCFARSGPMW